MPDDGLLGRAGRATGAAFPSTHEPTVSRAPELRAATDAEIQAISRESHALWGAGLDVDAYVAFWGELRASPWGRRHYRHCVWVDARGEVLSSVKLYRVRMRLLGHEVQATGIGAVFTPRAHRREGHAAAMLRTVLHEARAEGASLAILFTDIGVEYYARLGFTALPCEESWGTLARVGRPPAGLSARALEADDLDDVGAAHDAWCAGRPIAFLRDRLHWEYLLLRADAFYRRLDGSGLCDRYRVAMRDGAFAGYLVAVEGNGQWVLREVGSVGGDPDVMADIVRLGAHAARTEGVRQLYGWLAPELVARLPELRLTHAVRRHAVPMIRVLDPRLDTGRLLASSDLFLPFLDQF